MRHLNKCRQPCNLSNDFRYPLLSGSPPLECGSGMDKPNDIAESRFATNLKAFVSLGPPNYAICKTMALRLRSKSSSPMFLRSKFAAHPVQCRALTSDLKVFNQIFIQREYRCLDDIEGSGRIIDCGGYVGYSAAYLLTRFPDAAIIVVEPDPRNSKTLRQKLMPYGSRVTAIQSGGWSHPCDLVLSENQRGDGQEWGRQVRECRFGEDAAMEAVDIVLLLRNSPFETFFVLKIDAEGA